MAEDVKIVITGDSRNAQTALKKLSSQTDKTRKDTKSSMDSIKKSWLVIAGAAATIGIAAKQAFDLSKLASEFNQSVGAMERQFGVSSDKIISKLKEVSDGTISNRNIVLSANRAMALGVTKDTDKMAKLLEFARVRARAMGIDTTQAFNDIVTGIGRQSPLILDNLGLITKGWNKEAEAAGLAFDSQFVLNKVLDQASTELAKVGELTLTDAERFQKLNAQFENAKILIGNELLPVITNIITKFIEWNDQFDFLNRLISITRILLLTIKANILGLIAPFRVLLIPVIEGFKSLGAIIQAIANRDFVALKNISLDTFRNMFISGQELATELVDSFADIGKAGIDFYNGLKDESDTATNLQVKNAQKNLSTQENIFQRLKQLSDENKEKIIAAQKEIRDNIVTFSDDILQVQLNRLEAVDEADKAALKGAQRRVVNAAKAQKAISIADTIIDTIVSAQKAYRALAGIPVVGPVLATVAAATATAAGLARVALIKSTPIPEFQSGIDDFQGGQAVVGESGPEVVNLPAGSDVIPNRNVGGGVTITGPVTIKANNVTQMARELQKLSFSTGSRTMRR